MDTDIDNIWDLPVETSIRHASVEGQGLTSRPYSSNAPLFLPSDDEEEPAPVAPRATTTGTGTTAEPSANKDPDIDALFEGLDDIDDTFQELAPALDLDALRREADARNTRAVRAEINAMIPTTEFSAAAAKSNAGKAGPLDGIDGEGEDGGKKQRKPIPRLDEARLLGKNGLPQLVKDTKNFKPMGKGHEATDLDRVLQVYQFWAHKLYPKTRFKETIDRVEKLCHSKRMHVALSVWHDEAKGLVNGARLPPEDDDNDSNADSDADGAPRGNAAGQDATSSNPLSPAARSRRRRSGEATSDSEGDGNDSRLSSDASHPPPSSPERDEAAIELDALLEEEALLSSAHNASTSHAWKPSNDGDAVAMYEDEDLWDALDASAPASAPTTAPAPPATDDDEDMWDIVHELEQEREKEASRQTNTVQEPPAADDVQVDDLDDLYL